MSAIARTDTSIFGKWWWTVDRWTLGALFLLVLIGALLILAASPAVAERIGLSAYHFVQRQFMIMPVALALMVGVSLLSPLQIRRLSVLGFAATVVMLLLVPLVGNEIKGATRWISLGGFSLQPSEFTKPFFAVVTAWMFAEWRRDEAFPGHLVAIGLYLITAALLLSQPDLGMTVWSRRSGSGSSSWPACRWSWSSASSSSGCPG